MSEPQPPASGPVAPPYEAPQPAPPYPAPEPAPPTVPYAAPAATPFAPPPAAPYAAPVYPQYAPTALAAPPAAPTWSAAPPRPAGPRTLGLLAFAAAVVAFIVGVVLGSMVSFQIGSGLAQQATKLPDGLAALTPVRSWVLVGEVSFWTCTLLGIGSIVAGIIAIAKRRGRGWGIGALIIAFVAPIFASIVSFILFGIGVATAAASYPGI
ncbi:hypothetical protein [uncultured Microbacterium sp.]|uniref:hypothetical protein n=2 Tax=uncultured Microbacterium sp. TaxID=191216 RepID=UPI0025FF5997|nr:hypothetical protein [uncultured Microbacterium sp.]